MEHGSRGQVLPPFPWKLPVSDDKQEWQHQLRSSLHPALFAGFYLVFDKPMEYLSFYPQFRAIILSALPNAIQAISAGIGDYYTWQLAEKLYGKGSTTAWTAVRQTRLDLKSCTNIIPFSSYWLCLAPGNGFVQQEHSPALLKPR